MMGCVHQWGGGSLREALRQRLKVEIGRREEPGMPTPWRGALQAPLLSANYPPGTSTCTEPRVAKIDLI